MKKVFKSVAFLALAADVVMLVRAYGQYKYYSGKVESDKFHGEIEHHQTELIKDLCKKLKEKEESN